MSAPDTHNDDDAQQRSPRANVKSPRLLVWVLLLAPVIIVLLYPTAQRYLRAASLLKRIADPHATGYIANYDVHPVDVRDITLNFRGRPLPARLYLPRGIGFAPGIMVVHGMHEKGIDEPRLVAFARALSSSGFFVMTPSVPGIAEYRVTGESADVIGGAANSFARELDLPKVGVFALSFSGGLALLAASDPQYTGSIGWVASVGGHYDLAHVLRFFATGEALRPDGTVEHLKPHEYGPLIVLSDNAGDFFAPQDVDAARKAIKLLLSGDGKASEAVTATMTAGDQQTMQRIYRGERSSFSTEILSEIDKRQDQLAAASPAGHLRALHVPVLLLHGADDNIIPAAETLWLARDIPQDELRDVLISPAITHVEVGHKVTLRERLALVHWIATLLREAQAAGDNRRGLETPPGMWLTDPAKMQQIRSW